MSIKLTLCYAGASLWRGRARVDGAADQPCGQELPVTARIASINRLVVGTHPARTTDQVFLSELTKAQAACAASLGRRQFQGSSS